MRPAHNCATDGAGASGFRDVVSPELLPRVLEAFNHGITSTFCTSGSSKRSLILADGGAVVLAISAIAAAFIPFTRFQNAPGAAAPTA